MYAEAMNILKCSLLSEIYVFHDEHPFVYIAVIKSSFKAAPVGEGLPTRKEEEGEKMQTNPAYLPIEMPSYESQGHQYLNVELAPPDAAEVEEHTKMQANPAYLPIEMISHKRAST